MASRFVYVLSSGCRYEGYTVQSVHDTLAGAQNEPRASGSYDWLIEEVPLNGKPRWRWRRNSGTQVWTGGYVL